MENIPLWVTDWRWPSDQSDDIYDGDGHGVSLFSGYSGLGAGNHGYADGDGDSDDNEQFIPLGEITGA